MECRKCFLRALCGILLISLALATAPLCGFATEDSQSGLDSPALNSIRAKYALLFEPASGKVLFEIKGFTKAYPASTTKILTAIIVIENCNLDDEVTLGNSVETGGSTMGLKPGEKLSVRDLLYGMMMVSGNDAARALAEHVSGSKQAFATDYMNKYAAELGMENTNFVNPHGMDKEDHHTTAYDMALLTQYALQNETFRTLVSTERYVISSTNKRSAGYDLENTNRLIHMKDSDDESYLYDYATGVKTGDTPNAGKCLVASAKKGDMELIAVLFGYDESESLGPTRYIDAKTLFEYGFNGFSLVSGAELELVQTASCHVTNSVISQVELDIDLQNSFLCIPAEQATDITENAPLFVMRMSFDGSDTLAAPFSSGDVVGTVEYLYKNEVVLVANLVSKQTVEALGDSNVNSGVVMDDSEEDILADNAWLFWVVTACIIILIIIIIRLIAGRRSSQLHRKRAKRMRYIGRG